MNMKGTLPLLILHCLAEGPAHGYAIAQAIKRRSAGVLDFREGTLYPALHALEERGLIETVAAPAGERSRRCYRLSEAGQTALARGRSDWWRYARAVEAVLGGAA
jgi:DNA-binding PadR family transcriptional regulator